MDKTEIIHLLGRKLSLHVPQKGFRPGLDSIMLAAACPAKKADHVLDLGCGVGGSGLPLLYRVPGAHLTGIDIQENFIALAKQNAALNNLTPRTKFSPHSILDYVKYMGEQSDIRFNHVICNPPFLEDGEGTPSPTPNKSAAHNHSAQITLKDWIDAAYTAIKGRGSLTMIHRADTVDEIIRLLGKRFGAIEIIPLWPRQGAPAKRMIIRAVKNRKSPALIHPGIIIHKDNGDYTAQAEKILRDNSEI